VKNEYEKSVKLGNVAMFNQELMLRIMSEDDRLILEQDISWYKLASIMDHRERYNFYITTDFATSTKDSGDFSVISVWAYNNAGNWYWVDGRVRRQSMDVNIKDLFAFVSTYKPQEVGIEVSGQQGGFIPWIQEQMIERNVWFSLASENNSKNPGIRPTTNKLQRFNVMVPIFKAKKMFFPAEKKGSIEIAEFLDELGLASQGGFKSKHDDCIDTISMLANMNAWKPSEEIPLRQDSDGIWEEDDDDNEEVGIGSYIV
jgi:predicted phage terminase large subunit-like protein